MTGDDRTKDANGSATTAEFLRALFGEGVREDQCLVICNPKQFSKACSSIEEAAELTSKRTTQMEVYFGVALQPTSAVGKGKRGNAATTKGIGGVWVDVDIASGKHGTPARELPPSVETALEVVRAAIPFELSAVIQTGGGFHAWTFFREFWSFDSEEDRSKAARLVMAFQQAIRLAFKAHGWKLDSTHDLARVLRAPETLNHKYEPPREVRLIHWAPDRRINPHDLEEAPELATPPEDVPAQPVKGKGMRISPDARPRSDLFDEAMRDAKFRATWERRREDLQDSSQSGYDHSLIHFALRRGWEEQDIVDLCVAHARKHGQKLKTSGYYQRSIEKARKQIAEKRGVRKFTDMGNAERLKDRFGKELLYHEELGWLTWDGKRWRKNELGAAQFAKQSAREIWKEIAQTKNASLREEIARHAKRSEQSERLAATLKVARGEFAVHAEDLDAHPHLLNVLNGVLDLRTATLRPHDPALKLTKLVGAPYYQKARSEEWDRFLDVVTGSDRELQEFLQRHAGLCLSGLNEEDVVLLIHGPGGTGKSTYTETLLAVLGDYGSTIPFEALLVDEKGSQGPRPEISKLRGTRLAIATEVEPGRKFNAGLLKSISGGDTISARGLYRDPMEFRPQFKLVLAANDLPAVRGGDSGSWRRLRVVPFTQVIEAGSLDRGLRARLRTPDACTAILAWAVRGYQEYLRQGLGSCSAVDLATRMYQNHESVVALFVARCCERVAGARVTNEEFFRALQSFAKSVGLMAPSEEAAGRELTGLGFSTCKVGDQRGREGIRLRGAT